MKILVVYWHPPGVEMRATVRQHLHVLDSIYGGDVVYHNGFERFPRSVRTRRYRAIVLHNTFLCMRWSDRFTDYALNAEWIAGRRCAKLALPQDEYDHHEILDEWLHALGATHVFSNFGPDQRRVLYPILHDRVPFTEVLTGYIDERMASYARDHMTVFERRPLDVVYRSSNLPYWFGRQGQLKVEIGEATRAAAGRTGLAADISSRHEDTRYGLGWADLLLSGRATIGCETGSAALDHRGEIQAAVKAIQASRPDATFEEVSDSLPSGWDDHSFFAIGPRHLEAVVTKTCQLLVEGAYSGVLEPELHYLPLHADLSNLEESLAALGDTQAAVAMIERAYEDVYLSGRYTYATLGAELASAIDGSVERTLRLSNRNRRAMTFGRT